VLIGIFWTIKAPQMPAIFSPAILINIWTGGEGEYEEKTQFLLPDRKTIFVEAGPSPLVLHSKDQVVPTVYRLELPLKEFGTNWVRVLLDDHIVLEYPMSVIPVTLPSQEVNERDLVQGAG